MLTLHCLWQKDDVWVPNISSFFQFDRWLPWSLFLSPCPFSLEVVLSCPQKCVPCLDVADGVLMMQAKSCPIELALLCCDICLCCCVVSPVDWSDTSCNVHFLEVAVLFPIGCSFYGSDQGSVGWWMSWFWCALASVFSLSLCVQSELCAVVLWWLPACVLVGGGSHTVSIGLCRWAFP